MPLWHAILLGLIQGLTEFLPISSTAHLLVAREWLGHADPKDSFTTVVQLGTLVAVFVYFRTDILNILKAVWGDVRTKRFATTPDSRLAWLIVLGTIPAGLVGLLFQKKIKATFYNTQSMAVVAIVFALLMFAAEVWHKRRKKPELGQDDIGWREAVWMGVWQMLALMPGASRSGTTISGGLFAGLNRAAAARFSFLLSLPTILAAGLKDLYDEYKAYRTTGTGLFTSGDDMLNLVVATAVSGVVGYLSIAWLLGFLRKYSMNVFVIYRIVLGVGLLAWVAKGLTR
jgi:undecaprenyl-diphosphatase